MQKLIERKNILKKARMMEKQKFLKSIDKKEGSKSNIGVKVKKEKNL